MFKNPLADPFFFAPREIPLGLPLGRRFDDYVSYRMMICLLLPASYLAWGWFGFLGGKAYIFVLIKSAAFGWNCLWRYAYVISSTMALTSEQYK